MRFAITLLAALALLGVGSDARACSVIESYVRPSNFELVQIADAIVVARAEKQTGGDGFEGSVVFQIESSVKGKAPARVTLPFAAIGKTVPSDLADLSGSNPEGYMGPCNRMNFARGARYLLFLEHAKDGEWRQVGYPFSRVNEDYAGEDNAWVRTVRRYLRVQQGQPPMDQLAALGRMAQAGRDDSGAQLSDAERTDIADHLRSISQWKPTRYLLDVYARVERGETVTPRPDEENGEPGNLDEAARALLGESRSKPQQGAERARRMILIALAEGDHSDALPLFETLSARIDLDVDQRGLMLRYFARNGQYSRAYQWIETRLLAELGSLSSEDAERLLARVGEVQIGDSYGDGKERWRQDPHAAAAWPELALSVYRIAAATVGKDRIGGWLTDPLSEIQVSDYRKRPELTIALAAAFDEGVTRWATEELSRAHAPIDPDEHSLEPRDHPDMLPLRALASNWSTERIAALKRAFCEGGQRRQLTLLALGQDGDDLYDSLLAEMAGAPNLSEDEQGWVLRAAIGFQARRFGDARRASWMSGDPSAWLVTKLARGERPKPTAMCGLAAPQAKRG